MADKQPNSRDIKDNDLAGTPVRSLWFSPETPLHSPFGLLRRFAGEMDDLFEDFGFRKSHAWGQRAVPAGPETNWPQIDILQRNGELLVRADVPGLKKEDLHVEVHNDQLSITGERRDEREEQKGEYYRAERSYGRFERRIPLPQGTNPDDISCTFDNGTLEIRMKAPQLEAKSGRKIEIQEKGKTDTSGRAA